MCIHTLIITSACTQKIVKNPIDSSYGRNFSIEKKTSQTVENAIKFYLT